MFAHLSMKEGMSSEDYRRFDAQSQSDLARLLESPASYKAYKEEPPPPTEEMLFGTLFHTYMLEPEHLVEDQISPDDLVKLRRMKANLKSCPAAQTLLDPSFNKKIEYSFFGLYNGVRVKCRPDFHYFIDDDMEKLVICDLKTTKDANDFGKSIANWDYYLQAAFYMDFLKNYYQCFKVEVIFLFLAVDNEFPFLWGVHDIDDKSVRKGRLAYEDAISVYKECKRTNTWLSYHDGEIKKTGMPGWAYRA